MTKEQLAKLLEMLDNKNSWGKNEVKTLILEVAAGLHN